MKLWPFLLFSIFSCTQCLDILMPDAEFNTFLKSGSMEGFFTYTEFWDAYDNLLKDPQNARYLSPKITLGKSFEDRDIYGIYLTENVAKLDAQIKTKNMAFLDSLHHSREPLTLTMVLLLFREVLKHMRSPQHCRLKEFFRDNIIFVIPVLNVDSYIYINSHFKAENWENIKMIRKNRRIDPRCDELSGGVDLNRNYDFKFAFDNEGSSNNPCTEDYRGINPFSEPETYAVQKFVNEHPNIVSAVNLHSYGNAWIYPYNYIADKNDHELELQNRLFSDFLTQFKTDMEAKQLKALFGNSPFILDYSTNGEAGDWFTGKKDILGLDLELGSQDPLSDSFYPPQSMLSDIVRYNWLVMKEFLFSHIVEFKHRIIIYPKKISFEILNNSISTLSDGVIDVEFVFSKPVLPSGFLVEFCIKNLIVDVCTPIPMQNKEISSSVKGRHILEITLTFVNPQDLNLLDGLTFLVRRNEKYLDFEDQKYVFKSRV